MKKKPVIFMFSGQGAQYYQMGKALYDNNMVFHGWMNRLDALARELNGKSTVDIIFDPGKSKGDVFDDLLDSSIALFVIQNALAGTLIDYGIKPDMVLGASLGEFFSAIIAGVIDANGMFQKMIDVLRCIEERCEKGAMLGVLGDPHAFYKAPVLYMHSEIAAVNFSNHYVVACKNEKKEQIERYFQKESISCQALPVGIGFHSSLLDPAKMEFQKIAGGEFRRPPVLPIISCAYGGIMHDVNDHYIWDLFRRPVHFQKAIQALEKGGAYIYLDLGPSGTLATYVKHNLAKGAQSETYPVLSPFDQGQTCFNRVINIFESQTGNATGDKHPNLHHQFKTLDNDSERSYFKTF